MSWESMDDYERLIIIITISLIFSSGFFAAGIFLCFNIAIGAIKIKP